LSIDSKLLDIICCPVTRLPLEPVTEAQLAQLNERIREVKLRSRDDAVLTEELEAALVTRDGKIAYPIRDGIPVLLEDYGILLGQLEAT